MAGQIIKRGDGKFLIRWFIGRDARTGKRRYGSRIVEGTKKGAEAALRETLGQKDRGVLVESRRITLDKYLDEWAEKALPMAVRPRTALDYREMLVRYVRPILGPIRLDRLTPVDIQGMIEELRDRGCPGLSAENRRPLSPRTVRYAHAVLHRALV